MINRFHSAPEICNKTLAKRLTFACSDPGFEEHKQSFESFSHETILQTIGVFVVNTQVLCGAFLCATDTFLFIHSFLRHQDSVERPGASVPTKNAWTRGLWCKCERAIWCT